MPKCAVRLSFYRLKGLAISLKRLQKWMLSGTQFILITKKKRVETENIGYECH